MAEIPSASRPPHRPARLGVINATAIPKLNLYAPSEQFRIVLSELIALSPRSSQSMRVALGAWMRTTLSAVDPDITSDLPATPADEASAARSYWRRWYNDHRQVGYEVGKDDQPVARKEGRATIQEALDAANVAFKENEADDRFELAFGEGSTVVFPSSA